MRPLSTSEYVEWQQDAAGGGRGNAHHHREVDDSDLGAMVEESDLSAEDNDDEDLSTHLSEDSDEEQFALFETSQPMHW